MQNKAVGTSTQLLTLAPASKGTPGRGVSVMAGRVLLAWLARRSCQLDGPMSGSGRSRLEHCPRELPVGTEVVTSACWYGSHYPATRAPDNVKCSKRD